MSRFTELASNQGRLMMISPMYRSHPDLSRPHYRDAQHTRAVGNRCLRSMPKRFGRSSSRHRNAQCRSSARCARQESTIHPLGTFGNQYGRGDTLVAHPYALCQAHVPCARDLFAQSLVRRGRPSPQILRSSSRSGLGLCSTRWLALRSRRSAGHRRRSASRMGLTCPMQHPHRTPSPGHEVANARRLHSTSDS